MSNLRDVKYRTHFAITKSDDTKFHKPVTVYVGTTGHVNVVDWHTGATVLYKNFPQGYTLPIQVEKVLSTNTTAADMVGLY